MPMVDTRANIVLIEDSPNETTLTLALLRAPPYHVHLSSTGAMGLYLARRVRPEVVLLDIAAQHERATCANWKTPSATP
jgi:DNA-binding response OmpR family regulator